jgi:hypothetical protein
VQEINTAKGAGDDRIDGPAGASDVQLGVVANMGENVSLAHLDQSKLSVVAVGKVICPAVRTSE